MSRIELINELVKGMGYLTEKTLENVIELLGEDYEVVIKDTYGHRHLIPCCYVGQFEEVMHKGIRDVFISSGNLDSLKEELYIGENNNL